MMSPPSQRNEPWITNPSAPRAIALNHAPSRIIYVEDISGGVERPTTGENADKLERGSSEVISSDVVRKIDGAGGEMEINRGTFGQGTEIFGCFGLKDGGGAGFGELNY